MSDELRDRLSRADPARDLPDVAEAGRGLAELLEDIMRTEPESPPRTDPDGVAPNRPASRSVPRRRRLALAAVAVAACAALAVGIMAVLDGDGEGGSAGEVLALRSTEGDALAACLPVTAEFMAEMPVAFAATATAVEGTQVTLAVDRWYTGGDADTVVVTQAPEVSMALIGGVEFVEGASYLVTATDGVVNACGFSGPDTPELRAVFDDAFGG